MELGESVVSMGKRCAFAHRLPGCCRGSVRITRSAPTCAESNLGLLGAVCNISLRAIQNPLIYSVFMLEGYCESLIRMQ